MCNNVSTRLIIFFYFMLQVKNKQHRPEEDAFILKNGAVTNRYQHKNY
jgi:hypothetical protein